VIKSTFYKTPTSSPGSSTESQDIGHIVLDPTLQCLLNRLVDASLCSHVRRQTHVSQHRRLVQSHQISRRCRCQYLLLLQRRLVGRIIRLLQRACRLLQSRKFDHFPSWFFLVSLFYLISQGRNKYFKNRKKTSSLRNKNWLLFCDDRSTGTAPKEMVAFYGLVAGIAVAVFF